MFINAPPYNVEIKLSEKKEKEKQIFKFLKLNNKSRIYWHQWLEPLNFRKKIPEFDRFILTEYMDGQLGNQMFRFASLYAMGQLLERTPVYFLDKKIIQLIEKELKEVFPNFYSRIYYLDDFDDIYKVYFARHCCDYNDPKILLNHQSRVLMLTGGPNFINVQYFDHMRLRILELFKFSSRVVRKCSYIHKKLFSDDNSYKICVHTRVGDFTGFGESIVEEVSDAITRILIILKSHMKNSKRKFTLLMFGMDKNFLQSIKVDGSINKIFYVIDANLTRGEELNFASQSCDSFLSTASLSSYAFWMGF
uniref:Uncharacterized protein n=1 Tax=Meloidogyne enterolobii TaxID=390850 RepID=A0A6V7V0H9_MELEN|nr:unnamed protein product [Meloidogyne enterolobii]